MNIIVDNGVIIVEDFLTEETLSDLLEGRYGVTAVRDTEDERLVRRVKKDIRHKTLVNELYNFAISPDLMFTTAGWADSCWKALYYGKIRRTETAISEFDEGAYMRWHTDVGFDGRLFNWIIGLNDPEDGGELEWNFDTLPRGDASYDYEGEPVSSVVIEQNKLVLMPAWFPHRVTRCWSKRVVAHGHWSIGWM